MQEIGLVVVSHQIINTYLQIQIEKYTTQKIMKNLQLLT